MSDINDIEQFYASGTTSPIPYIWQNTQSEFDRKDLLCMFTPEATYNFNTPLSTGLTYLKTSGILQETIKYNAAGDSPMGLQKWGSTFPNVIGAPMADREFITKAKETTSTVNYNEEFHWEKISAFQVQPPGYGGDVPYSIGGLQYRNYSFETGNNADVPKGAYNGTSIICKMDAGDVDLFDNSPSLYTSGTSDRPWANNYGRAFLTDFIKLNQNQYGGIGAESITFNNFISITNSISALNTTTTEVFGGDIFIGMFEFMKNFWDNGLAAGDNFSFYECVLFPVESTINFHLNHGVTFTRGASYDHNSDGTAEHYRAQENGMFAYNPVFSSEFLSRYYQIKPFDFIENNIFDVRNYLSLPKIIGEQIDSWCKYPINSFLDVEPNHGPINETCSHMGEVFYFQDNAIGYLSINPRAVVTAQDGIPTELGSGEGIVKYNYLTKNSGCIHQWAVLPLTSSVYFFDANRQTFNVLKGTSPENLSTTKGLDSIFRELRGNVLLTKTEGGDNPIEGLGIHLGFNPKYEEVYITILGNDSVLDENTAQTIVYNPRWDNFRAKYSFWPSIYLNNRKFLLSNSHNSGEAHKLYLYNRGLNGVIFNEIKESSITFTINELADITKVLKFIQYDLTVKDTLGNYFTNEGLTHIRIQADYQDTGKVSLTARQRNRFNLWRIFRVPRNILQTGKISRIRNDWFRVTLYFDNVSGKTINLERVLTAYVPQNGIS